MASIPPLSTLTVPQVAEGLDSGKFTVVELVKAHIHRIDKLNPTLHAVIDVNPAAVSIAESLDKELKEGRRRGPLHGVPVLVKENVAIFEDGLEPAAGSTALVGARPPVENPSVTKLREAGAIILGTANLSEWANFRSEPSDNGWSARGGQTIGAYCEDMNAGGSSSGSGVAVDMGLCVLAIGTETAGSIISPTNRGNIVGIKPTVGLVPRTSVVPISFHQDSVGPMTRTVEDAALMLSYMVVGKDPSDSKTDLIPFTEIPDYTKAAKQTSLSGFKLGIGRNALAELPKSVMEIFDSLVEQLRAAGAEIVDFDFPALAAYKALTPMASCDFIAGDFKTTLNTYLSHLQTNPQGITDLAALTQYTKAAGDKEDYPARNSVRFEQGLEWDFSSEEWKKVEEARTYFAEEGGIGGALEKYGLDAIISVCEPAAANYFAAAGGYPHMSVPLGYSAPDTEVKRNDSGHLVNTAPNVPYGFSAIGDRFFEEKLIAICAVAERLTHARDQADKHRLPKFREGGSLLS